MTKKLVLGLLLAFGLSTTLVACAGGESPTTTPDAPADAPAESPAGSPSP